MATWGTCEHHAPDAPVDCSNADCHLDPGIYEIVWGLHEAGLKCQSSCQGGGLPHAYQRPMVHLTATTEAEAQRVMTTAVGLGMPVWMLVKKQWPDDYYQWWELEFTGAVWGPRAALAPAQQQEAQR